MLFNWWGDLFMEIWNSFWYDDGAVSVMTASDRVQVPREVDCGGIWIVYPKRKKEWMKGPCSWRWWCDIGSRQSLNTYTNGWRLMIGGIGRINKRWNGARSNWDCDADYCDGFVLRLTGITWTRKRRNGWKQLVEEVGTLKLGGGSEREIEWD